MNATHEAQINPYAPPAARLVPQTAGTATEAESIRRELLKHETSVRSIGTLYYLSFGALVLGTIAMTAVIASGEANGLAIGMMALYGLLAGLSFYLARGLRCLDPKVRGAATLLSAIGLIGFPLGTLVNGYILYLLHCDKGKRVMTEEYRDVIARTPHIKYRTPLWLIVVALAILGLIVTLIVIAFNS